MSAPSSSPAPPQDRQPSADLASKPDPNRRSSFNFLRRQKSNETSSRGSMLSKRNKGHQYPPQQSVPRVPPQLPNPTPLPTMDGFIGDARSASGVRYGTPGSYAAASPLHQSSSPPNYEVPVPPMPSSPSHLKNGGDYVDPYARTESMTHRGRYSYASSAISTTGINSPRRVRRRKDPTPFNILVIGAQNSGKTSFIEFLKTSLTSKHKYDKQTSPPATAMAFDSAFIPTYLETEFDHERIGVTLWDSQGLEKKFVDLQLREMSSFLESKFEETFTEEQKVVRAPGVRDTHIHCVFLILDPSRLDSNLVRSRKKDKSPSTRFEEPLRLMGILDEDLDVQVLKTLQGKTTVIPVISKADTITANHMSMLKRAVWDSLKQAKLDPLEALTINEDEDDGDDRLDERDEDAALENDDIIDNLIDRSSDSETASAVPAPHKRSPSGLSVRLSQAALDDSKSDSPYLPMSIISPDTYEPGVVGRRFPWGFADPLDPDHCDFVRLKDSVFSEWRGELREASREIWYEGWRTSRLNRRGNTAAGGKGSIAHAIATTPASTNGRARNLSGATAATAQSGVYGGPVGRAASATAVAAPGSSYSAHSAQAQRAPSGGAVPTQEMIKGVYRQGVNAF